jgi:hypothetical protein
MALKIVLSESIILKGGKGCEINLAENRSVVEKQTMNIER